MQPGRDSWSLGQVYMHLINEITNYNLAQVEACISCNDNENSTKTPEGEQVFAAGAFPDALLKGPSSAAPPQPVSTEEIRNVLLYITTTLSDLQQRIQTTLYKGKTRHPGFGWLNALEWLQFIEMHLRQKERLDKLLRNSNPGFQ